MEATDKLVITEKSRHVVGQDFPEDFQYLLNE